MQGATPGTSQRDQLLMIRYKLPVMVPVQGRILGVAGWREVQFSGATISTEQCPPEAASQCGQHTPLVRVGNSHGVSLLLHHRR